MKFEEHGKKGGRVAIVAPLAGAWIEIGISKKMVLRSRVAPLAGAWIEIYMLTRKSLETWGRSPRGSVD